ncbi:porin [Cupriavidus sp. IDO]|uniref:porin n=1 Tax=Cupriavidus sp. IDO TaxID=1539142 RepID=UPI00057988A4|nr:porin [Cupriavidus sp. IDO]KWR81272.1 porin [Cupriavidus sp. IDO]
MKRCVIAAAAMLLACPASHAESGVNLYGLISTGIVYANNQNGHSQVQLANGPMQTPRWGLRGTEELGGGNTAFYTLEGGFAIDTGTLSQGGRLFGRQAFVGMSSPVLGTISLGRQYDLSAATLWSYESATQFAAFGTHIGDSDNVFNTFRVNNTIAYKSPSYGGLQFAGMMSLGEKPGDFRSNNAYSLGVSYKRNDLSLGIAYEELNTPNSAGNQSGAVVGDYGFSSPFVTSKASGAKVDHQRIFGAGGAYQFGKVGVSALYTNVRFDYLDNTRLTVNNGEISVTDYITPNLLLGAAYIYTWGEYQPGGSQPKWHQVNLGADYFLSKRTDLFLVGIYQRAAGDATYAQIYTLSPSSTRSQVTAVTGIRHKF